MNRLGAPACRVKALEQRLTSRRPRGIAAIIPQGRPVGSRKPELAGGTPVVAELCPGKPALPGGSWGGAMSANPACGKSGGGLL